MSSGKTVSWASASAWIARSCELVVADQSTLKQKVARPRNYRQRPSQSSGRPRLHHRIRLANSGNANACVAFANPVPDSDAHLL
jgi:hypothetical protein